MDVHLPCWGITTGGAAGGARLYSSAIIQWLVRKAMKKIPSLINQVWFVARVWCREELFLKTYFNVLDVVFCYCCCLFVFNVTRSQSLTACGLLFLAMDKKDNAKSYLFFLQHCSKDFNSRVFKPNSTESFQHISYYVYTSFFEK